MSRWSLSILFFAGLAGAAGLITAASAAHVTQDPFLNTAASILQVQAAATIAILAFAGPERGHWFLKAAASLLLGGCYLFAGDLLFHAWRGERLFPMAAPLGGSLMIIGWIGVALAALVRLIRPQTK
ncbi:DUF423 domain-containing protein [Beijerinckia indica]|nr:DUF423 domain-containing protein [Beijerinckia indica]